MSKAKTLQLPPTFQQCKKDIVAIKNTHDAHFRHIIESLENEKPDFSCIIELEGLMYDAAKILSNIYETCPDEVAQ